MSLVAAPQGAVIPDDLDLTKNAGELLKRKWNDGKLPDEPGLHHEVSFTDGPLWLQRGSQYREASVRATVHIERRLRFGYLPIAEITGFRNESTGSTVTLGFRTGPLDVRDVETKWRPLASRDELTVTPVIELMMHDVAPPAGETPISLSHGAE